MIDENPGVVSPGVLARPAIQDAVLGTAIQVVGPGELSYMAQAAVDPRGAGGRRRPSWRCGRRR